jgi:hypothetical protein
MSLGTIFLDVEHGIEVGAEDTLKVLTTTSIDLAKVTAATPKVAAALAVVLAQVGAAVSDVSGAAAAGGLNFTLDQATLTAIKAVWPDVTAFLLTLGVCI